LAVLSQQFALLALVPLVVVAPSSRRIRFVGSSVALTILVLTPLAVLTSGRVVRAVFLGSGNSASLGGTVLWEMHLHGTMLVGASRILPILLSIVLARWVMRRLGPLALGPVALISLIATSISLRLIFEQNLFGYYFMALAVLLVVLDIVSGRLRGQLIAWIGLLVLVYSPVPWGFLPNSVAYGLQEREFLPYVFMGIALACIVRDAAYGRVRGYLIAWLTLVVLTFGRLPWSSIPIRHPFPTWFWQVTLVATGLALALQPLLSLVRARSVPGDTSMEESSLPI